VTNFFFMQTQADRFSEYLFRHLRGDAKQKKFFIKFVKEFFQKPKSCDL